MKRKKEEQDRQRKEREMAAAAMTVGNSENGETDMNTVPLESVGSSELRVVAAVPCMRCRELQSNCVFMECGSSGVCIQCHISGQECRGGTTVAGAGAKRSREGMDLSDEGEKGKRRAFHVEVRENSTEISEVPRAVPGLVEFVKTSTGRLLQSVECMRQDRLAMHRELAGFREDVRQGLSALNATLERLATEKRSKRGGHANRRQEIAQSTPSVTNLQPSTTQLVSDTERNERREGALQKDVTRLK